MAHKVKTRVDEKEKVTDAIKLVEKVYIELSSNGNFASANSGGSLTNF